MEIQQHVLELVLGVLLFVCAIMDIKYKKISLILLGTVFVGMLIILPFRKEISMIEGLCGILVGGSLFGINKVTRGQIGIGDACLFCVTGVCLGFWDNMGLLLYSLFFASIFSAFLILIKKVGKKYTIPFAPFVLLGFVGVMML